jgi:hypothetical protein
MRAAGDPVDSVVATIGSRRTFARCTQRAVPGLESVPVSTQPRTAAAPDPVPFTAVADVVAAALPRKRGRQAGQKIGVQAQPELEQRMFAVARS